MKGKWEASRGRANKIQNVYIFGVCQNKRRPVLQRERQLSGRISSRRFFFSLLFFLFFSKLETNRRRLTRTVFDSNVFLTVCQEVGGEEEFVEIFFFLLFFSFLSFSVGERTIWTGSGELDTGGYFEERRYCVLK